MNGRRLAYLLAPALLLAIVHSEVGAATAAGEVQTLEGTARAFTERGMARALREGAAVFSGEELRTDENSRISVKFRDGTRFELGEDSTMKVDRFVYGEGERDTIATRVVKGVFRFVSGLIAKRKPRSMSVFLPVVTIGIRGTNVGGEVTETTATVVLLEPEEEDGPTAIEVSNQFGTVTIDEPGFGTDVPDQFSPPSPPRRMQLRTIQNLIRSINTIQRIRVPRPMIRR